MYNIINVPEYEHQWHIFKMFSFQPEFQFETFRKLTNEIGMKNSFDVIVLCCRDIH